MASVVAGPGPTNELYMLKLAIGTWKLCPALFVIPNLY